jgi:hypothetical protein
MSHITVIVEEVEPKPRKPRKTVGTRAEAARAARTPAVAAVPTQPRRSVSIATQPADGYADSEPIIAVHPDESIALELEDAVEAEPEVNVAEAEGAGENEPLEQNDEVVGQTDKHADAE